MKILKLLCFCLFLKAQAQYTTHSVDLSYLPKDKPEYNIKMGSKGKEDIKVNSLYLELNKKPWLAVMGEYHFQRVPFGINPQNHWKETLLKMKASGVDIVSSYVFWSMVERKKGKLDWKGGNDLGKFLQIAKEVGIKVWLRIGPYCNAELRHGGLPDWLFKEKLNVRTNDQKYLGFVDQWYQSVSYQIKDWLHKNDGPVIGIQLENEYVTTGLVNSHLMLLKEIAINKGIDVPFYSMTHWMATEFPQGEIIPFAGYYIEMPWANTTEKLPPSDYLFFNYNRIANNIGTDIIKEQKDVLTLNNQKIKSPYFTCEVGLGNQVLKHRRPILDDASAGANIGMRLGSGVNLMGYYMYAGGTNPILDDQWFGNGNVNKISYDFMAPISESGAVDHMYKEVKKYNYFMNRFGEDLAKTTTFFPKANKNTSNLQWSVRYGDHGGYLFVNNYQRVWSRPTFKNQRFQLQLENQLLTIPSKGGIDIIDKSYFHFPIHQDFNEAHCVYALAQPITSIKNKKEEWFFFQELEAIPTEFLFDLKNISSYHGKAIFEEKKGKLLIHSLVVGFTNVITLNLKSGKQVLISIIDKTQAHQLWKFKTKEKEFVIFSQNGLFLNQDKLTVFGEQTTQELYSYPHLNLDYKTTWVGRFQKITINHKEKKFKLKYKAVSHISKDKSYLLKIPKQALKYDYPLRLKVNYVADKLEVNVGNQLIQDNIWNGLDFQLDVSRYRSKLVDKELSISLKGFVEEKPKVYLEDHIDRDQLNISRINKAALIPEYRAEIKLK